MNVFSLGLLIAMLLACAGTFVWLALKVENLTGMANEAKEQADLYTDTAERDVEHIFNDEFREELRNRGRLHFEKIIGENAMFLQQDLRLTTSQLNEFMKQEITKTLQEEFVKYEQSIDEAKKMAIESLEKSQHALEEEREVLRRKLEQEVDAQRERLIGRFSDNMAEIVNHYVLDAIGNEIDLTDQLEYILGELHANKNVIVEDIRSGA